MMGDQSQYQLTDQLHRAIHAELIHEVKRLVEEGAQLDRVHGMRGTALCAAIEARNLEIVTYLLQSGCDVNARDFDGEPPILLALRKDSLGQISGRVPCLGIIRKVIQHKDCNVNKFDRLTKKCAIHFAVEQGMVEAVKWLIEKTGTFKCKINVSDLQGNTPLHLAVHEGVSDVVQVLVDHPDCLLKVYNNAGLIPLHISANTGDVKSLNILLKKLQSSHSKLELERLELEGDFESELLSNINAVTMFEKESALHLAVRNSHEDVISVLLANDADVNLKNNINNSPLMLSMVAVKQWQNMDNNIPKALLKRGADPNVRGAVRCRYLRTGVEVTPLIIAIHNENLDLVKCLVASGADINMVDNFGDTPLSIALSQQQHEIASYLLTECKGINVNIQNCKGETCLHAVPKCHKQHQPDATAELIRLLVAAGAEIHADSKGRTVIERAIDYENPVVIDAIFEEFQMSANIPFDTADSYDEVRVSLIHFAVAAGLFDIVRVLLSHGADIDDKTSSGESNLHIALKNHEFKIVRFLVENGCDFVNEPYMVINYDGKHDINESSNDNPVETTDSDSDSSDDDYNSDDSDEDMLADEDLRKWLTGIAVNPRTLKLLCLVTIRKHFVDRRMALCKIGSLPLPDKLKACIRYQE